MSAKHLDYYHDEYTFRFNRRKSRSRGKLFYRLLQQSVEIAPVGVNNFETTIFLNLGIQFFFSRSQPPNPRVRIAIQSLFDDLEEAKRPGDNARQKVELQLSWTQVAQSIVNLACAKGCVQANVSDPTVHEPNNHNAI